jgi:hypothetical protein
MNHHNKPSKQSYEIYVYSYIDLAVEDLKKKKNIYLIIDENL